MFVCLLVLCAAIPRPPIGFRPGVPQILGCAASRDFEVIEGIEAAANENSSDEENDDGFSSI